MTPRSRNVCIGCGAGHFEKTVAFPFGRRRRQYSMEDIPMTSRLRFGVFLAPFHKPGINPTLALQNDLDLVAWLDRLGYDEAWFGEHHSAGTEISASPEIMIAVAASHQAWHGRRQPLLPQSAVGRGTHRAARSPDPRARDVRCRTR